MSGIKERRLENVRLAGVLPSIKLLYPKIRKKLMSTFQIRKSDSINLRNIVISEPFNATERAIQYGVQYALACGIKCNAHYSEKAPELLKITIQNKEANVEIANLLEFHVSTISIKQEV